jgi:hypothetical protein
VSQNFISSPDASKHTGAPRRHPLLEVRLNAVARKLRDKNFHVRAATVWAGVLLVSLISLGLRYVSGVEISWALPLTAGLILAATTYLWFYSRRHARLDLRAAVQDIEARHPELGQALRTAVEQQATDGKFNFLQKRVIGQVLDHADRHVWTPPRAPLAWAKRIHVAMLLASFAALAGIATSDRIAPGKPIVLPNLAPKRLTLLPGTVEVEKGSVVVVSARFDGPMPPEAQLVWSKPDGAPLAQRMAKNLADPVFALALPPLEHDVVYHVAYGEEKSETHRISVFVLPALERSDASLTFPEYTGLPPKKIEQTRRVSAVEGTGLTFDFFTNKRVARAVLIDADGTETALRQANAEGTHYQASFVVQQSRRFALKLTDEKERTNNPPIDIRVEAIANKRPDVRLTSPTGDVRVSPIEEVRLQAQARDEFGLLDYGVAVAIGDGEAEYVSLKGSEAAPVEAKFHHLLRLEERNVEPGQLITWFAWADDFGPDGARRRTTGDLNFAEVRPLDEIFREDESGGAAQAQSNPGSEEGEELLELQREISLAIWRQRQNSPAAENFTKDLETIRQSQEHVRSRLQQIIAELPDEQARRAAAEASKHMDATVEALKEAEAERTVAPLDRAARSAQQAYQELLKLAPKETSVAQASNRNSSRGNSRGNQRQLNQLEFTQAENRYETETQAQPITPPEQREQLQALSRLRELARRQQETNERLQELQTALSAARDEAEREQVRRELKRLEEEQRRLLADTDELRDRMDQMQPSERTQQARQELEQTREDMRRASERLERGEVSSALASGTRAAENLQDIRDEFRKSASSQFSEQLREARQRARELTEQQRQTEAGLKELASGSEKRLDDSARREEIARAIEEQKESREALLRQLRQVAEDSEASEPGLHRRIYDLLRQHGQGATGEQMEASAEMLRRGFVDQASDALTQSGRDVDQLRRSIERAAESILGDQSSELRYAQSELEQLSKQLEVERNRGDQSGGNEQAEGASKAAGNRELEARETSGASEGNAPEGQQIAGGDSESRGESSTDPSQPRRVPGRPQTGQEMAEGLRRLLNELRPGREAGPLTGEGFSQWIERLRTVEELTEVPEARERLARARETAEAARREFKRHSREPQWGSIESGIATPLAEARALLRQELSRLEEPESLQPIDRDPVPEKYAESVRKYYEALGQ